MTVIRFSIIKHTYTYIYLQHKFNMRGWLFSEMLLFVKLIPETEIEWSNNWGIVTNHGNIDPCTKISNFLFEFSEEISNFFFFK